MASGTEGSSFADLYEKPDVESQELLDCMEEYAVGKWAITGGVVIEIADRANLKTAEIARLGSLANIGVNAQLGGGRFGSRPLRDDAYEYLLVQSYTQYRLAEIAASN